MWLEEMVEDNKSADKKLNAALLTIDCPQRGAAPDGE